MALRTFQSNPSLGGFGGESIRLGENDGASDGNTSNETEDADAFSQIIKELVDNAVDACRINEHDNTNNSSANSISSRTKRRVRVRIHRDESETTLQKREILRVSVVDNGVGMKNIQACVDPFFTNKGHNGARQSVIATATEQAAAANILNGSQNESRPDSGPQARHTAGRYGIGLTLCLLHAQRLVPSTRTSVLSATRDMDHWMEVTCVVDTKNDSIQCVSKARVAKQSFSSGSSPEQSGTNVSLLLPGGAFAQAAWPRVFEYMKRFQLSLDLSCTIEVLAPTLSRLPLYVEPIELVEPAVPEAAETQDMDISQHAPSGTNDDIRHRSQLQEEETYIDLMAVDDMNFGETTGLMRAQALTVNQPAKKKNKKLSKDFQLRSRLQRAVQKYLGQDVQLENVAHTMVPIRRKKDPSARSSVAQPSTQNGSTDSSTQNRQTNQRDLRSTNSRGRSQPSNSATSRQDDIPQLQVHMIVYQKKEEVEEETANASTSAGSGEIGADMTIVRMVNGVPLLDSSQAIACGLVQGLDNRKLWQSFGLEAKLRSLGDNTTASRTPTFCVRDSAQVAPFFQKYLSHNHAAFYPDEQNRSEDDDSDNDASVESTGSQNKHSRGRKKKTRSTKNQQMCLLPAKPRLGNLMLVVQINANPNTLPLPTLCKGRLPLEDSSISTALDVAVTRCLRQIQQTNPALFLTSKQLKNLERDVVLIPALSQSLVSVISNARSRDEAVDAFRNRVVVDPNDDEDQQNLILVSAIEEKIRTAIKVREGSKKEKKKAEVSPANQESEEPSPAKYRELHEYENETKSCSQDSIEDYRDIFQMSQNADGENGSFSGSDSSLESQYSLEDL